MIIYSDSSGNITQVVFDKDRLSSRADLVGEVYDVDEIVENQDLILDILRHLGRYNGDRETKYFVSGGSLFIRDNWIEDADIL